MKGHCALRRYLIIVLLLLPASGVIAKELTQQQTVTEGPEVVLEGPPLPKGWVSQSANWLELHRNQLTDTFSVTAENIDRYIARDNYDESVVNESYLRLRIKQRFERAGSRTFETDLKVKVDLPGSSKKYKLMFDSSPDDFEALGEKRRDISTGSGSGADVEDSAIVGISIDGDDEKTWQRKLNVGMKLKLPLDPYTRLRLYRVDDLSEYWQSVTRQTFSYFHTEGWAAEIEQDFFHALSDRLLFQSSSAGQFLDPTNEWELFQSLALHQRLNQKTALRYEIGANAFSRPSMKIENYWLRLEWQRRLYKQWLFFKIIPELAYPREEDFYIQPSLFLELEVFFSKHSGHRAINSVFSRFEK